jgi:hypothetical protein
MSWFDTNWSHRAAIVIDNLSGASTIDVTAVLPNDFAPLWDNIQATGNDFRVTLADGKTLATYDLDSFNYGNKQGTIEVDNVAAASADAMVVLWLYWGNASAPAATTTFTPSSAKTGHVMPDCMPAGHIVTAGEQRPGDTKPKTRIQKTVAEELHCWWDMRGMLSRRNTTFEGSPLCEEIEYITFAVQRAGSDEPSTYDENETRILGSGLIRTTIKGGQDGNDYTLILTVKTTEGKILNPRALMLVRDIKES